ncbi:thioesterase II family protein [Streptomyces sp. NPDC127084]|uniref:thioesterase II family protein n=1 Tax=Streptomyces sp. NPDC127084 TaxID=3347133 RepID=UPI00364C3222
MGQSRQDPSEWVHVFHPVPEAERQLVCFPHAGGSASYYYALSAALSTSRSDVQVSVVQYPGRADRLSDAPLTSMDTLADKIHEALGPILGQRPYFFGHSMGAVAAFEVALRAERAGGHGPERLIASACVAPSRRVDMGLRHLDDAGVLAGIMGLGGTQDVLNDHPEVAELILPAIRADLRMIEPYRAGTDVKLDCPVSVFAPDSDPRVPLADSEAWAEHTNAAADVHVFQGGHFYFNDVPDEFAERLGGALV